ncbi:MAG: [FeFe] hydrogenase H-cluster radical SAM maturase HydE, partial [Desulfovibrio sp.]
MPDRAELLHLLCDEPAGSLRQEAEKITLAQKGSHVFVRGLLEFSNRCKRNCLYCGLRAQNSTIRRYLLPQEAIIASSEMAVAAGADTVVLQAGEGGFDAGWLADIVRAITSRLGV